MEISVGRLLTALGFLAVSGGTASAHAVERGLILLLPTGYYVIGGALAVAVSFAVLAALPEGWSRRRFARRRGLSLPITRIAPLVQWAAFAGFWALLLAGIQGTRDPLLNPLPLVVWTLGCIGLPLLVAVLGDAWRCINPWTAPVALLRRLLGPAAYRLPLLAGYWPAIAGFGLVVWFEAISLAPDDPAVLARAAALHRLVQFAGFGLFGRRWGARDEGFSVLYRLQPDRRRAVLSQLPLVVLMVGLTLLGLWLLSTPTVV